ncbi:hypothetical protein SARC_11715, partial [Sphaeroforma arctica JP610]
APQHSTKAWTTPTDHLTIGRADDIKRISPVKRRIRRAKPVPQVAPHDNVYDTRRKCMLEHGQKRAQEVPAPDEMPTEFVALVVLRNRQL